jgi:DNA-binding LacI/PurR family transcriptional regulator
MLNSPSEKLPTLHDVAERAGVSHITVSRVVNGKTNVSPETRERVMVAMQELGYIPNPAAQALQTRRTKVIELVSTDLWGLRSDALWNITHRVRLGGFQFSILPTVPEEVYDTLEAIPNRLVAGTILHAQQVDINYQRISELIRNLPFVHMGGKLHSNLPSVTFDQFYAAQLATQHLIDLGHRQIAHIAGNQSLLDGKLRYQAWLKTLGDNGLEAGPVVVGDFGEDSGAQMAELLLESGRAFTAIFAASDAMAIAAIDVFQSRGVRIPEDVSIIGFDDIRIGKYIQPRLSTVTNDMATMATLSIEYLLQLIQSPQNRDHQRILTAQLIPRQSTRALNPVNKT